MLLTLTLSGAGDDFGNYLAVGLTSEKIDGCKKERLAKGDRPASINRPLQLIRQAYGLAELQAEDAKGDGDEENARSIPMVGKDQVLNVSAVSIYAPARVWWLGLSEDSKQHSMCSSIGVDLE